MAKAKTKEINEPNETEVWSEQSPYILAIEIEGTSDLLLHRWKPEDIEAKKAAKKNSSGKKDNPESYVYRNEEGYICMPTEYLRMSIVNAAKYRQDPRSSRKSAADLFKAGVIGLSILCSLGTKEWEYEDTRRAVVQRQGVNRVRPAFKKGWTAKFELMVILPGYIDKDLLLDVITDAGTLVGVGDMRPTYGRFRIKNYEVRAN